MVEYRIDRIGYKAYKTICSEAKGQVIGVTSRGLFLEVGEDQVVFLSDERAISPLTATIGSGAIDWHEFHMREEVRIDKMAVCIGQSKYFSLDGAQVWQPSLPVTAAHQDVTAIHQRLVEVSRRLITLKGDTGWAGCLAHLTGQPFTTELVELVKVEKNIHHLRLAMYSERMDQVLAAIKPFFGSGRGLTPSGDDFIIGMLLGLSRWPFIVTYHPNLQALTEMIVAGSAQSTTRISRAMISSAAEGAADERLLNALEGIVSGNRTAHDCAELLADYGGSSGIDALTGFAALMVV